MRKKIVYPLTATGSGGSGGSSDSVKIVSPAHDINRQYYPESINVLPDGGAFGITASGGTQSNSRPMALLCATTGAYPHSMSADYRYPSFVSSITFTDNCFGANYLNSIELGSVSGIFQIAICKSSAAPNVFEFKNYSTKTKRYVITTEEVPTPPTTDGTYKLRCTVTNGTATYEWVVDN